MDDSPNAPEAGPAPDCVPLRLVLQPGGAVIEVSRPEVLVGRHSEVDVRLPLPDVSRRHCRFVYADGIWRVFDLRSLNGVYVNGERIAAKYKREEFRETASTRKVSAERLAEMSGAKAVAM